MALSLYNKYRPQTFKDVVGQEHVEKTLANAVEKNKVSHAYLFCGPRGTGKTTTARILAKALLCNKAPTASPDGTCEHCREIAEGVHPDVYELDAASRTGVDNVREEIIGRVSFAPTQGNYKIYIIDEVHMLSTAAFNALLKTLEEPPTHVVFMLCTTDVHKVPDTVQARCQRFDFKHLAINEIIGRLQYICEREGFDNDPAALELIAQRSKGGMRDAIRSLEQVAVFSGGKITYVAAESLLGMVDVDQLFVLGNNLAERDAAACFNWVAGYVQSGSDIAILVNDLALHIRNLYAVSVSQSPDEHLTSALEIEALMLPKLREQAVRFGSPDRLAWTLTVLGALSAELKNAANARLALEVALTRILRPESGLSLESLAARIAALEEQMAAGSTSAGYSVEAGALSSVSSAQAEATGAKEASSAGSEEPEPLLSEKAQAETDVDSEAATDTDPEPGARSLKEESPGESRISGDDQSLYRQWNSVVDAIKKKKRGLAANLGGAAPRLSKDGKRLILELPAGADTSRQYLETDTNREMLRDTVVKIFGEPLEISLSVANEPAVEQKSNKNDYPKSENNSPFTEEPTLTFEQAAQQEPIPSAEENTEINAAEEPVAEPAEPAEEQEAAPKTDKEVQQEPDSEPSKEELDSILRNSTGSQIEFKE